MLYYTYLNNLQLDKYFFGEYMKCRRPVSEYDTENGILYFDRCDFGFVASAFVCSFCF
jgi:hypothetical protein